MNYGMDYQGSGGFSSNSGGSSGNMMNTSPAASRSRPSYDEQTVTPVTCRMALTAHEMDGSAVLEDDRKVYHVKLVGAVRSVLENSSNVVFEIEDGTGMLEVKQWLDLANECSRQTEMRQQVSVEHIYVKIVGQLKIFNGQPLLLADNIRPIKTGNELAHHMLDVVYSAEKQSRQEMYVAPPPIGGGMGVPLQAASGMAGGDPVQDAVISFFRDHGDSNVGASVKVAIKTLAGRFNESQIIAAVNHLSNEGTIYSTVDEEHFKFV